MRALLLSGLCGLALLGAACGSDTVTGPEMPYAAVTPACGAADGPAVAIYLAHAPITSLDPSPPYVRIYIEQPINQLAGQSWTVGGAAADAAAWRTTDEPAVEAAQGGTVRVDAVRDSQVVEGFVDLTFPEGGRVQQAFRATWLAETVLCA
ncbi:MAG TPA: hypothetical protein VFJ96_07125 [Gemmatimonadaceae bacterium]|nr:hypothetical protein [Gemmatimonadaceae bacterium]